jgi:hypothetical protein
LLLTFFVAPLFLLNKTRFVEQKRGLFNKKVGATKSGEQQLLLSDFVAPLFC